MCCERCVDVKGCYNMLLCCTFVSGTGRVPASKGVLMGIWMCYVVLSSL